MVSTTIKKRIIELEKRARPALQKVAPAYFARTVTSLIEALGGDPPDDPAAVGRAIIEALEARRAS
jgi:hypothetical protein